MATYHSLQQAEEILNRLHSEAIQRKDGKSASNYHWALKSIAEEYKRVIPAERDANSTITRLNAEL